MVLVMMKRVNLRKQRALCLFLLLCIASISATCQEQRRRPSRYLIPEGYVGWVRIDFNIIDAPPLPIEDGYYLFKIPPSGLLQTSSDIEYGWASDEFYYYSGESRRKLLSSGWGGGGMVWGGYNGSSGNHPERTNVHAGLFIGTEEEFNRYGPLKDENYNPRVGNVKTMPASNNSFNPTPR